MAVLNLDAAIATVKAHRDHLARTHANVPAWDAPGIRSMLVAADGPPTDILAAALLTAGDPSCRLPSAAALRHHWPVNARTEAPAPRNIDRCPEHGEDRATCTRCDRTPARTETIVEAMQTVRRHVEQAKIRHLAEERRALLKGHKP